MKFLVDAQLPPGLCRLLNRSGHDALHASQLPRQNLTTDQEIIVNADADGRAIITKDTDFYYSHVLYSRPAKLLLVRTGNIGVADLVGLFDGQLTEIVEALTTHDLVEVDRTSIRPRRSPGDAHGSTTL